MALALWELTLEDLVHSDVSDKLLHGVVFQVAVSSVHLKCLVANLLGLQEATLRAREKKKNRFPNSRKHYAKKKQKKTTHVKALLRDEELGHGAKRNGVGPVLLQRRGSLAHQQARRHQVGGHFGQLELQILQNAVGDSVSGWTCERFTSKNKNTVSPGCWRASLQTASGPTCDLLLAARWRAPLPENRTLWAERVRIGRQLKSEEA